MTHTQSLNVAIVGLGYWGAKLIRNVKSSEHFAIKYLIDTQGTLLEKFKLSNPEIAVSASIKNALSDNYVDCIIIATPPNTHYELAKESLLANKHVLIEKPFTTSFEQAQELFELSRRMNKKIMVDYTFLYNGAVECIKKEISKNTFGGITYIDSVRINLGSFIRTDINVVWDLACHDVSIFNYLLEELPNSIRAIGIDGLDNKIENIAYIYLQYSNKFAHINCSWASPVKIRTMLIGGRCKAVLYNDIEPTDKVRVYDKGVVFDEYKEREALLQDYRSGQVFIPKYDITEPLSKMIDEFYDLVMFDKKSNSNIEDALLITFILENIQKSMELGGKEVALNWGQVGQPLYAYISDKGLLKEVQNTLL